MLAKELLEGTQNDSSIAVVSAPSVFIQLKNLLVCHWGTDDIRSTTNGPSKASKTYENPRVSLLEFDRRFDVFKEFVYYDFQTPLNLPGEHQKASFICIFLAFDTQFSRDEREI